MRQGLAPSEVAVQQPVLLIAPPGGGLSHTLRRRSQRLEAAGHRVIMVGGLESDLGGVSPILLGLVGPAAVDPVGSPEEVAALAEGDVLIVDDAHLLSEEDLQLLSSLVHTWTVIVGTHAHPRGVSLLRAALGPDRTEHVLQPLDERALTEVLAAQGLVADPDLADASGGLPALAFALAARSGERSDWSRRERELIAALAEFADVDRRWLSSVGLLRAHVPGPVLSGVVGDPPGSLLELGRASVRDGVIGLHPPRLADLAAAAYEGDRRAELLAELGERVDDPVLACRLLVAADEPERAQAVARAAARTVIDLDQRSRLLALAAGDDDDARLVAARWACARELPQTTRTLLTADVGSTDESSGADGGEDGLRPPALQARRVLAAATARQLDELGRLEHLGSLPETSREHLRASVWFGTPAPGSGAISLADPVAILERLDVPDPVLDPLDAAIDLRAADDLDRHRFRVELELWASALDGAYEELLATIESARSSGARWAAWLDEVESLIGFHRSGDRATIGRWESDERIPAGLPRVLIGAHRVIAAADRGASSDALYLARSLAAVHLDGEGRVPAALSRWALAEAELAAGHPVAASRLATADEDDRLPTWWLLLLVRSWSAWERREGCAEVPATRPPWRLVAPVPVELEALRLVDADDPAAIEVFSNAANQWEPLQWRASVRCRWAAGEAARRIGRTDQAVELLSVLEPELEAAGALPMLARTRTSLRACGRRSASARATGVGTLSAREVEVLGLVAKGLTTRQIAVRLAVSISTVETQVTSAMQKLGVRTRVQAVLALQEQSS